MRSLALLVFALVCIVGALQAADCCAEKDHWVTVETIGEPLPRHEAAFVEFGGKFYLLGGRRVQPVSIYDPETNKWQQGSRPPLEVHHFQPVVYEDRILIIGAMTGKFPRESPVPEILAYYPVSDTWKWEGEIPPERRRGSAGVVNVDGLLYIACGIVNGHMGGYVSWMDRYDPKTQRWEVLPDAPHQRDHFQCALLDGKIYAAGGRRTSKETEQVFELVVEAVDVFDLATETWSTLEKPLPTPRAGNSTMAFDTSILVAGGETATQKTAHAEVEAWDTIVREWSTWPPLNRGRHGTGLILHNSYIYTCSGSGNRGGSPELTSMERLRVGPQCHP